MTLFGLFSPSQKGVKKVSKDEAVNLWFDGFRAGFDKAFSCMPEMQEEIRKKLESKTIKETLERLNRGDLLQKD